MKNGLEAQEGLDPTITSLKDEGLDPSTTFLVLVQWGNNAYKLEQKKKAQGPLAKEKTDCSKIADPDKDKGISNSARLK